MAITSDDIHNQSFSIDRKGYDVDEVDVFLEHVANEIDAMNHQIFDLESQLEDSRFSGFDTEATIEDDATEESTKAMPPVSAAPEAPAADASLAGQSVVAAQPVAPVEPSPQTDELQERIAFLEKQLEEKSANDNAIAQALIVAQRSADDVVAKAKAEANRIIQDADDEANRIVDKAEAERQKIQEAIRGLEDDRDDTCSDYRELLNNFVEDANKKIAEIDSTFRTFAHNAHVRTDSSRSSVNALPSSRDQELQSSSAKDYTVPVNAAAVTYTPATPESAGPDKDFSGFGDVDDDFEFDDPD